MSSIIYTPLKVINIINDITHEIKQKIFFIFYYMDIVGSYI